MAKKLTYDPVLFTVILVLLLLGVAMVYSAGTAVARAQGLEPNTFLLRQLTWAVLGLSLCGLMMVIDYRHLRRRVIVYGALAVVGAMLAAALFSPALNETHRWLFVGSLSVQPSELAKLALIVFIAYQIERHREQLGQDFKHMLPTVIAVVTLSGLVLLEPDLGTACMLALIAAVMLFLAGLRWRWVILGALTGGGALAIFIAMADYRRQRLFAFLAPERDPLGSGFQALQSLIAVGSGGLLGRGPGRSLQKLFFLPYPHSDFIYAIVAEELGLLGALGVLALFGIFLWRGIRAGLHAPDPFGRYLAWGISAAIVLQALINISVVVALLPTKGIPLPFISYGGSSLVVTLAACGLLLNVSQHG
jgi:cell division protein FtsW